MEHLHPISIRDVMRFLERHICRKVAGSRRNYRTFYNFSIIKSDGTNELKVALDEELNALQLDENHVALILFLKETGDNFPRKMLTRREWDEIIVDEDDTQQDIEEKRNLLVALEVFNPVSSVDNWWIITAPK